MSDFPSTLGSLRNSSFSEQRIGVRSVKDELRQNLDDKIKAIVEVCKKDAAPK